MILDGLEPGDCCRVSLVHCMLSRDIGWLAPGACLGIHLLILFLLSMYTVSRCPVILDGLEPGDCCLVIPSYTVSSCLVILDGLEPGDCCRVIPLYTVSRCPVILDGLEPVH